MEASRVQGAYVRDRLRERRERANASTAAAEKSLRKYQTVVFSPFRERIDLWFHTGVRDRVVLGTTSYEYLANQHEAWRPNNMMNWMMQPFYDYDEPEFGEVIEVRVSSTTIVGCGRNMREVISDELREMRDRLDRIPSIMDYATQLLGWGVTSDLLPNLRDSSLMTSIVAFLQKHDFTFPADASVEIDGRSLHRDLIMCSKYYPNRDDNRAYCRDFNKLRTLVGASLQRLILPRRMRQRRNLHYIKEIVPAVNKDKIHHRVRKAEGYVHLVTIIDISNFTGSAANAWLMLTSMAMELAHGKIRGKFSNMYCCNGVHFHASVLEIIVLYLYLTVGYPCVLAESGEVRFLPGGFLGVNANISVALLFYAVLLSWLSRNRESYLRYMKSQAGGDDVYILTKIKRDDMVKTKAWLRKNLTKYVGNIKELSSFVAEDVVDDVVVADIKFCRKMIRVVDEGDTLLVETCPTVPLNEVLTSERIPSCPRTQQKVFRTVLTELRRHEERYPDQQWITDALLYMAAARLPRAKPSQIALTYHQPTVDFVAVGSRLCSEKSVALAQNVEPVYHLSNVYYGTVEQAVIFLLCRGILCSQLVNIGGSLISVVMSKEESRSYRSRCVERREMVVAVTADLAVVDYLLT